MRALALALAAAVAAGALAGAPGAARAADGDIRLAIKGCRDGRPLARHGAWTWIAVELENKGAAAVEGVLRAFRGSGVRPSERSAIVFERRVSLAPGARRLERVPYFCRDENARVVVALFAEGSPAEPLAHEATELASRRDFNVVVVSRDDAAYAMFRDAEVGAMRRRPVFAAPLRIEELPDRAEAYGAVDGVLVADVDLRALTPAQGEALEGFVESGGQLVACFGGNAGEYKDSALAPLLPVEAPERVEPRPVPALAAFAGAAGDAIPGDALVAVARPVPGAAALVREGGIPLAVRRRAGAGAVTYLAVDPTRRPLRGSPAGPGLVGRLFGASDPAARLGPLGTEVDDPLLERLISLTNLAAVRPPPFIVIGSLLAAYVVLVVPLNFSFWRARGRAERAAPTAAALGLLAGAAIYGLGIAYKGRIGLMSEVVLVETSEGAARGRTSAWLGVYSAERRLARVLSALPVAPMAVPRGRPEAVEAARAATVALDAGGEAGERRRHALESVELDQWANRRLHAHGTAEAPRIRTDLALDPGGLLGGTIEAPPDTALRGAIIAVGRRIAAVGDLAAGAARTTALELLPRGEWDEALRALAAGGAGIGLTADEVEVILDLRPVLPPDERGLEAVLIAAIDPAPETIIAPDYGPPRARASRLLVAAAPVALAPGAVTIPRGFVRPRVTAEIEGTITAQGGLAQAFFLPSEWRGERVFQLDRGQVDFEFTLPGRERLAPATVAIDLRLARDAPKIRAYLRAPDGREQTVRLEGSLLEVPEPARFYDPRTGTIRFLVRVPADAGGVAFLEPEIRVEGSLAPPSPAPPR